MSEEAKIRGLLLDMDGVIYVGDKLLDGATRALDYIHKKKIPFKFITNTTTRTPIDLIAKLDSLGITVSQNEIFTAISATLQYLRARGNPSCYLLLREGIKPLFSEFKEDSNTPDYVVIGDIGASWNYENLNAVFNMLMQGSRLICMHRNKYWQGEQGLLMDIGAFVAALEYVSGKEALVIGKPSPAFFQQAIEALGLGRDRVAIVGDDIDSDIGGGQASRIKGILVKTGKYRESYASHSSIKPDFTIDSIASLPGLLASLT